jgi:hypothetical protein
VCHLNHKGKMCKPIKAATFNVEQHLKKSHGKYEAPASPAQLTLEQTLVRQRELVARSKLSMTDAANRVAVILGNRIAANGVPAEQIAELNELLPLFRVVQSIPSASILLKQGGAQGNDAAALKAHRAERLRGQPLTLYMDASNTKYIAAAKRSRWSLPTLPHPVSLLVKLEDGSALLRLGLPDRHGRHPRVRAAEGWHCRHRDGQHGLLVRDAGFQHFPCVAPARREPHDVRHSEGA